MPADPETAFTVACGGEHLVCIHHGAAAGARLGVVVIVGGPQYRVGSHRQFVHLARGLVRAGFPVLRFDCRGMGDSSGAERSFEDVDADVRAAVDALLARSPSLEGVVLWGLCDAASAALMYAHRDPRVRGLVLANPWVRTQAGEARARIGDYYTGRLASRGFWRKLAAGGIDWRDSARSLAGALRRALARGGDAPGYVGRMLEGLERFRGPVALILSGDDLTAAEFRRLARGDRRWRRAVRRRVQETWVLEGASHTFSSAAWRDAVTARTAEWLRRWT